MKNTGSSSWSGAFYLKSGSTNWLSWSKSISAGSTVTLTGTYTPTATGTYTVTLYYQTGGSGEGVKVPAGSYSNPFSVTVVAQVGTPNSSTFSATNISSTGFTANWGAVTGATKYNVNVKKASESDYTNALRYTGITGTSAAIGGLQPSTSYQFQVQAENSYGKGQWSASSSAITTLSAPASLAMAGGDYFGTSTLVKGQEYTFTVKVKNTGSSSWSGAFYLKSGSTNWLSWSKTISAGSTVTLTGTYTPTTTGGNTLTLYYQTGGSGAGVKVPAGSYENPFNVTVVSALGKPNSSTFTATNITSTSFKANWGAVSGATGYDILVKKATDTNYNNPVVNGGSSYTSFDVVGLQPNTRYQFQVRAKNDGYKGEWSSSSSVITTLGSSSGTVDLVLKGSAGFSTTELFKGETYNYSTVVWNKSSYSWSGTLILKEGTTVVYSQTYTIPKESGKPISIPYTPTSTGNKNFTLYYKTGSNGTLTIVPPGSYSNPITVHVAERTSAYANLKMNSDINCSSSSVVIGNKVTLSASIKNEGSSWTGMLCISDNGATINSKTYTIGKGVSQPIGCTWTPTTVGEHVIKVSYITANQNDEYAVAANGSYVSSKIISVINSGTNTDTRAYISCVTKGLAPEVVNEGADVYYYYRVTNTNGEPMAGVTATFNYTLNSTTKTPITSPASDADGIIMLTLGTTGSDAIAKSGQTAVLSFNGMKNSSGTAVTLLGARPASISLKVRGGGSFSAFSKVEKVKFTLDRGVGGKYESPGGLLTLSAGLSWPVSLSFKFDDSGHASEIIVDTEQEISGKGKVEYSNCLDVNAEGSVGLKQHTAFNNNYPTATSIMVAATMAEATMLFTSRLSNLAIQTFDSWISNNSSWLSKSIEEQQDSWFYGWEVGAKVDLLKAFPCNQGAIGTILHMPGSFFLNGFKVDAKAGVKCEPDALKIKNLSTVQYGSTSSAKLKVNGEVKGAFGVALFNPNKSWLNKSRVTAAVEGGLLGGALFFGAESTDAVVSIKDEQWYTTKAKTTLSEISNEIEVTTGKKISFEDLDICKDWVDIEAEASLSNIVSHKLVSKGAFAAYLQQAASQSSNNRSLISNAFPVFTQEGIIASPQRYYNVWGNDFTNSIMKLNVPNPSNYSLENSLKVEQQNTSKADCKVTIPFGLPWKIPVINKPLQITFDIGLTLEVENYPSESYYSVPLKRFFPVVLQPASTIKEMAKEVTDWVANKIKNIFSNDDLDDLGNISGDLCSAYSEDGSGNLVFTNGSGAGGGGGGNWATRRLSSFAKRKRPALARMSQNDICRLSLSVNEGTQNFDAGTRFDYMSFYPAGGLLAVTNTGDTLFVLSDVTELSATYNNTSLKKTKKGKMKLETYVGADDLTPFGFPENTPLDILHANEGSDVWYYVGPAGTTVQVDSLGSYVLATSIRNDVVKPTIVASLDEKNKVLHISVTDNIGVRLNTLKVFINGELREMHVINEANLEVILTDEDMKYRMTVRASVIDIAGNMGESTQMFLLDKPDKFDLSHFMGDINRDGFIDVVDLIASIDFALGGQGDNYLADLDRNGTVDISDVIQLIDVVLGNTVLNSIKGDLNGDGYIDIADLSAMINIVLGNQNGDPVVADLNNSGAIDVDDMNILIDIVLGKSGSSISLSSSNEIITVKGIYMNEMMAVEDGAFTIGVANERGFEGFSSNEVTLSSLKIGDYEVTQELWLAVMGTIQASFTGNLKHPVKNVSWDDCQQFITRLNTISGKTFQLSLVTE